MAIVYNWMFPTITDYPNQADQVNTTFIVYWKLTASDTNNRNAEINGTTNITYKENDVYIPRNELTNEILLEWITREDAMGNLEAHKQQITNMLQSRIVNDINTTDK